MKIVIFGLTVSSSWGNGHATLWRGLCKSLGRRGHRVVFYEKDVPYYAAARDLTELPGGGTLRLYGSFEEIVPEARRELAGADMAMTTSYCPDGPAAAALVLDSGAEIRAFYDLDTPVTLERLRVGESVSYLPAGGLGDFDLVLSYTGGRALEELRSRLGARRVAPLYGSVDPDAHYPVQAAEEYRADLSYLGTYAEDRQEALEELFIGAARKAPQRKFLIGGAMYPQSFPWTDNIFFVRHTPPACHPAFYCSSRATLNVTRKAMADYGYCPSGRLFEAAACGAAVLTDVWEGLGTFFDLGTEMLPVRSSAEVVRALELSDAELQALGRAARARALEEHTAERRVLALETLCAASPAGVGL
jgi:spore maturation protein CgeB